MKRFLLVCLSIAILGTLSARAYAADFELTSGVIGTDIDGNPYTVLDYRVFQALGDYLEAGDSMTLFDVGYSPVNLAGLISDPSVFEISTNYEFSTGLPTLITVNDPALLDVRFTYIGSTPLIDRELGSFTLVGNSGGGLRGLDTEITKHNADGFSDHGNRMYGPAVAPEPSTLILLGTGVLGLAQVVRRRFVS